MKRRRRKMRVLDKQKKGSRTQKSRPNPARFR